MNPSDDKSGGHRGTLTGRVGDVDKRCRRRSVMEWHSRHPCPGATCGVLPSALAQPANSLGRHRRRLGRSAPSILIEIPSCNTSHHNELPNGICMLSAGKKVELTQSMQRIDWHARSVLAPCSLGKEPAVGVLARDGDAQPRSAMRAQVAIVPLITHAAFSIACASEGRGKGNEGQGGPA